jgi:hypothetical protein
VSNKHEKKIQFNNTQNRENMEEEKQKKIHQAKPQYE